jgi:hypothetical protein
LLAQAVLAGRTKGYTRHPQLTRFSGRPDPLSSVGAYLLAVADEADARGYRFDRSRVLRPEPARALIEVTDGQLGHEWHHLRAKLAARSPEWLRGLDDVASPDPHPLFRVEPGPVADWERATDASPVGGFAR